MATTRGQWQQDLDELYRQLRLAEASLREAEEEGRPEQAERARKRMDILNTEIRMHHEEPGAR